MKEALKESNYIRKFNQINSLIVTSLDEAYEPFHLVGMQHIFVTVICRNPGIQQKQFNDLFSLHGSNITRNIHMLEKDGYLTREKDPNDSRGWLLYPTKKAKQHYKEIVKIFDALQSDLLKGFSQKEESMFSEFLNRILNNLQKTESVDR